ncbi:hypothetical protein B8043_19425 [Klebsiella aerogenes]|nr:hypothetical protein B8043_19425 [Klebsiella aerogenes]
MKRRSADGSVGSPHVRVGNCQASNKTKGSVGRLGLLFCVLRPEAPPSSPVALRLPGLQTP